jgi:hydroxymethylbilane synthase
VKARIEAAGGPLCRIVTIKTTGDRLQEAPLSEIGGKRLFVKEIEDALMRDEIDLAVHSSKDMPAVLPDGLIVAAVLPREDPRDAVILPVRVKDEGVASVVSGFSQTPVIASVDDLVAVLGQSPSVGTGSVRRIAQLTRLIPNARFVPIRGNLDTRLRKLDEGEYDALILAAAGLRRLGFGHRISFALPADGCVPAPGQGIVAIEIRAGDAVTRSAVERIDDAAAAEAFTAERALVETLGGGCQTPIGALATHCAGGMLALAATVVALDGSRAIRGHGIGPRSEAAALGASVGAQLLDEGAGEILAAAAHPASTTGPAIGDRD